MVQGFFFEMLTPKIGLVQYNEMPREPNDVRIQTGAEVSDAHRNCYLTVYLSLCRKKLYEQNLLQNTHNKYRHSSLCILCKQQGEIGFGLDFKCINFKSL